MSLLRRGQIQHALQAIPISTNNSTDQHAPQTQTYAVQIPKVWFFFENNMAIVSFVFAVLETVVLFKKSLIYIYRLS